MSTQSLHYAMHKGGDDFDHIFSDAELQSFLDKVAAADNPHDDNLGDMFADAPLGLQFLPPDNSPVLHQHFGTLNGANTSQMSSYDELPRTASTPVAPATAQANAAAQLKALTLIAAQQQHCNSSSSTSALGLDALSSLGITAPLSLSSPSFSHSLGLGSVRGAKAPAEKPQISHSTVEKQRRDRINSLIDELRDLVPPSKATLAAAAAAGGSAKDAANSEARRPKHVVLADTIALLKQLSLKGPLNMLLQAPPPRFSNNMESITTNSLNPIATHAMQVKEEIHTSPSNSNSKGSVSSQEDMDTKDDGRTAAPKLPIVSTMPRIPIQPTMFSGVAVEKGPGANCMYVQVKCRDRKGLLLDIINAMKGLPMEVRTAAVTTQDGLVRDVFEVAVDDQTLQPEEVQNMVHEALFQQYAPGDKRARN